MHPVSSNRQSGSAALLAFALPVAIYLLTMPRLITLEDAGLFQMICHQGGIGHPPGYPLFVLSCQGFVGLPFFDSSVFAGNLLSALFAGLACVVLMFAGKELLGETRPALMMALLYGFSTTFWSQAIIIEVYSLQVLLFATSFYLCLRYRHTPDERLLYLLALTAGLGLSNHWPLFGLAAPALLIILGSRLAALFEVLRRPLKFLLLLVLLSAGLSPYLSLLQEDPTHAVFGPVGSVAELIEYVTRSAYSDHSEAAGLTDRLDFQQWLVALTLRQFSIYLAPLMLLGVVVSFWRLGVTLALALVLLYLGGTTLLMLLTGFEFNNLRVAIFRPYPVIAFIAPAVWTSLGACWVIDRASQYRSLPPAGIAAALVAITLLANLPANNRGRDDFAQRYGEKVLAGVPAGATLFVEGDNGVGLLGYLHHVAGWRQDLELRSWNNLVFANRLVSPFSTDDIQDASRQTFISDHPGPVYGTVHHGARVVDHGLLYEFGDRGGFACDGRLHGYIDDLVDIYLTTSLQDGHERELLFGILLDLTRQHVGLLLMERSVDDEEVEVLARLEETFPGKLATLETMIQYPQSELGKGKLEALAEAAFKEQPALTSRQVAAVLWEFHGRIALMQPQDTMKAIRSFEKSLEIYPVSSNTSLCPLATLYQKESRTSQLARLTRDFTFDCP